jgi:hypothetical protein
MIARIFAALTDPSENKRNEEFSSDLYHKCAQELSKN